MLGEFGLTSIFIPGGNLGTILFRLEKTSFLVVIQQIYIYIFICIYILPLSHKSGEVWACNCLRTYTFPIIL